MVNMVKVYISVVPCIRARTGSRAHSITGPALWNALPVPIRHAQTILNLYVIWLSHPSSSVAQFPVDQPALARIMPHESPRNEQLKLLG